jgi:hypothetical protein
MSSVERSEIFGVSEELDSSVKNFFSVYIKVGCRLVTENADTKTDDIFAQVEATFIAEYMLSADLAVTDEEALTAFAVENASFHVWPYWREYLMATCTRLNLPKGALPVRQFTPKSEV